MIAYEDLVVGTVIDLGEVVADRTEMIEFAQRYDPQPFHLDDEAASRSIFGKLAASGWYTSGLWMRRYVATVLDDSTSIASPGCKDLTWPAPVFAGDVLRCRLEVLSARLSASQPGMGILELLGTAHRDEQCVLRATFIAMFGTRD